MSGVRCRCRVTGVGCRCRVTGCRCRVQVTGAGVGWQVSGAGVGWLTLCRWQVQVSGVRCRFFFTKAKIPYIIPYRPAKGQYFTLPHQSDQTPIGVIGFRWVRVQSDESEFSPSSIRSESELSPSSVRSESELNPIRIRSESQTPESHQNPIRVRPESNQNPTRIWSEFDQTVSFVETYTGIVMIYSYVFDEESLDTTLRPNLHNTNNGM